MWDSEVYSVGTMSSPSYTLGMVAWLTLVSLYCLYPLRSGGLANTGVTSLVHYEVLIIWLTLVLMHPYRPSRMDLGLISPFKFLFYFCQHSWPSHSLNNFFFLGGGEENKNLETNFKGE